MLAAVAFFFSAVHPAQSQAVRGLAALGHLRTEFFDIYHASSLGKEALDLATYADPVCRQIASILGMEPPSGRIPVLLSDTSASLNGYSSSYPSNRIVIFLAAAEPGGELASFQDELKSVFIHELTHSFGLAAKGSFWRMLSLLAGDYITPVAWMVPQAVLEGTAVWMESQPSLYGNPGGQEDSSFQEEAGGLPAGRLHDPSALAVVYRERREGIARSLWEVSGLADHPGAGNLPYLYGALFVEYLVDTWGEQIAGQLWNESGRGNLARGFSGTLSSKGVMEFLTGLASQDIWDGFLAWLDAKAAPRIQPQHAPGQEAVPPVVTEGRIGAFCANGKRIAWVDLDRRAVYLQDEGRTSFLFAGDGYIDSLRFSEDGHFLIAEWVMPDSGGYLVPALHEWDIARRRFGTATARKLPAAGEALANLTQGAPVPYLHGAGGVLPDGWSYGLARFGTRILPARLSPEGGMELLETRLSGFRSISAAPGPDPGQTVIAGTVTGPGGIARLILVRGSLSGWRLLDTGGMFEGLEAPVATSDGRLVFRITDPDGRKTLRQTGPGFLERVPEATAEELRWIGLESFRAGIGEQDTASAGNADLEVLPSRRFPSFLATARSIESDAHRVAVSFEAEDLSERLSWNLTTGWDREAEVPETEAGFSLDIDSTGLAFSISDLTYVSARVLGFAARWSNDFILMPVHRKLSFAASLGLAGIDNHHDLQDIFSPSFDYRSAALSLEAGFSNMHAGSFAPFDPQGFALELMFQHEHLPGTGQGSGWELFFSDSAATAVAAGIQIAHGNPAFSLHLHGAASLSDQLRFSPGKRSFYVDGKELISAMALPYPLYREYSRMEGGLHWYAFGQGEVRLANLELDKGAEVRLPFLPSLGFRRMGLWAGSRLAVFAPGSGLALPSSAYSRAELDMALLAGLAAMGHLTFGMEVAWAFDADNADEGPLSLEFSLGARL
jgi:hypothetical protein